MEWCCIIRSIIFIGAAIALFFSRCLFLEGTYEKGTYERAYERATIVPTLTVTATWTPTITPILTSTKTPTPRRYIINSNVEGKFAHGLEDAGASEDIIARFLNKIVPCEHGWTDTPHWDKGTGETYFGWAQFLRFTFNSVAEITGFADWSDPYHQGFNTYILIKLKSEGGLGADPYTQWPNCWE